MITLPTTSTKLQVVLAGAKATTDCPFSVSYADVQILGSVGGGQIENDGNANGVTNGVTAVDMLTAPTVQNTARRVRQLTIFNADTAAVTVTVRLNDGGTTRVLYTGTLQVGELLQYDENGFAALDTNANVKTNQPASSGASSTADSKGTSAGTAASTADSKGASGGTAASTADSKGASGGTAASAADSKAVSVSANTSTADSKALSVSTLTSTADSKAVSVSANTSVADSKAVSVSANTSVADSKAVSDSANTSVALSTASSVGTSSSTGLSSLTSRVSSKGG